MQYSSGSSLPFPQFENFQHVEVVLTLVSTALPVQPENLPNSLNQLSIVLPHPSNFPQRPSIGFTGLPSRPHCVKKNVCVCVCGDSDAPGVDRKLVRDANTKKKKDDRGVVFGGRMVASYTYCWF